MELTADMQLKSLTCEYEPLLIFFYMKLTKILPCELCPKYPNFESSFLS